jgi:hypothetical protein
MGGYLSKIFDFSKSAGYVAALTAVLVAAGTARGHSHADAKPVPAETRAAAEQITQDLARLDAQRRRAGAHDA